MSDGHTCCPEMTVGVKRERDESVDSTAHIGSHATAVNVGHSVEIAVPTPSMPSLVPPKPVIYIRDDELTSYTFGMFVPQHAMKPYRIAATQDRKSVV